MSESLRDRARESERERDGGGWGRRVQLEPGETFEGRWRGETTATGGDYGDQRLFLLWDSDGAECYLRGHASLVRKVEAVAPSVGDSIAVYRGGDYSSAAGTGYSYGLAAEPCFDALPEQPEYGDLGDVDDDIPW